MKTQLKRFSKSTLAVVLSICMVLSVMAVGIIATDAAVNWYDFSGNNHHYIYYDDSTANISAGGSKNIYMLMDYGSGSNVFTMTRVSSNTLLYYLDYNNKWSGCTAVAVKAGTSAPATSTRYTSCDRYSTSGNFNGNAVAFMYGAASGKTLNCTPWDGNGGDLKTNIKNNVTLKTKVASAGSSTYTETNTTIADLTLSSHYWDNGNVSSAGNASGFSNGSVTYNNAVGAAAISFSYSNLNSNYNFIGWYDSNGNELGTDSTYSGYQQGHVSAITYYAYFQEKPTETKYTVSVSSQDTTKGTVASSSVQAGATTAVTLPTATPNYGYKFKNWTASGGGVSITNPTSANAATITATGTSGTVTANFEKDDGMNLYIAGRFHIYNGSSWVNSFDSGDWSNTGDDNIKFTWDSTAQKYKVETGASPAELTSQISNINPYFFVYDKTNTKNWYATSSTTLTNSNKSVTLSKTSGANNNLRFNATSTDKPVTLWFDATTGVLSYTIPTYYDVTVNSATGGTVTASPTRAESGATVTLTISPSSGYQLSSISAKRTGTSTTVALSGTGNTRTFTMPAAGVTVTPVFEKLSYAVSVDAKYSNDGTNFDQTFPSGSKPAVTIAADTATQVDGVAVTAPATDPTGYVFAGWYTTTGSFANAANKDTTFKPNAANAVAIAKYKKIFTITSSVDNTGTGAGTVSTGVSEVVAGGSYTITAAAKSGSAVESVKVNGTAKTATASQTISSVSANQEVVVKFKSNVYLKGTMNATAWAGDVMTANTAGTSYTIANVVLNAGTTYEFKHWVDSGGDGTYSTTVGTWTLNNIATHSTKSDGYGGTNLTITPSVKAKVTFVSDGTKFTSITAIPYDSTTYNVTLTQSADYTITSTYMGVEYTTSGKSANVTVPVYSSTSFSYTVVPTSGKYLSAVAQSNSVALSPTFAVASHSASYTGTVSSVSKAFTVSATANAKLAVTAKTNKSSRGTVSVSPTTARPGETVTITVSPKNGVLKTLTYTYGSTTVTLYPSQSSSLNASQLDVAAVTSLVYNFFGKADEALGAVSGDEALGTDQNFTFTMPSSAVTVNATYDTYTAESNWYYNGYNTSGSALSGYHSKQMTEGMVGGEKFSYYHVEGRTGSDQLMTVSDGKLAETRYVYFTRPNSFSYWNQSNSPKAHFWKDGGSSYDTWPGNTMTWVYNNDMGQGVFKIAIPEGVDRVSFNDGSNSSTQQTVDINLTNTTGAYYVSEWNDSAQKYNYGTWNTGYDDQGWIASGTEYFYQNSTHNGDYTGDFNTKGFYNHNTANKEFAKPKDLGSNTGDYYINVLYPNTTYTINGVTKKTGTNPMIIWSAEPLAGDEDSVKVYAKDGAIRSESFGSTYANIADTQIVASASSTTSIGTSHNGNISGQTYETYNAAKGDTIYIRTTINTTAGTGADTTTNRNKYYVRGFCINGEVFELKTWDSSGVYTTSYKIPEDYEGKYVEITPIYYLNDTTNHPIVTYRVTGFTDALKEVGTGKPGWGDTLYTYPFYGKLGGQNNALGAYPGQPMVYYKGQYQMQIPEQSTAWDVYLSDSALSGTDAQKKTQISTTNVSGVTMSNGYYDIVHRQIMGYGNNGASADHVQTYDYGDFFKIFNEKAPVDNIVFDFKYETAKHNFENQPAASITKSTLDTNYGTNGNGFELLTNFHGRHVDLFGTPLSGDAADPEKTTPVYVVSIGGVNGSAGVENIAGYYATEWMVYGSSNGSDYTRITGGGKNSIPPEVLVLNNKTDSFNNTVYPSAVSGKNLTDWQALYTNLEAYRGKPVMISYEAADAQIGAGNYATSGGGGATRNDGRWLYSKNGETITSNIRVDVSENNGATYSPNPASGEGHISDLDAYFTNAEAEGETTYTTTIDPDKTFDFEAHSNNADYKFMGWYMADGTKITLDNIGHTERSGSYTFVARFMHFTGGQLILGHKATKDSTYTGDGTATIAVTVKDGNNEIVREIAATSSDITLDDTIINNENTAYTIEVTLNAAGSGEDTYAITECSAANTFFGGQSAYTTMPQTFSFTVGDLFTDSTQNVKKITYNSYFDKVQYTYKYTFNFPGRGSNTNNKSYVREGTLTAAQREAYVTGTGNESRVFTEAFVNSLAPHESNFNQNLKWNISASDRTFTKSGNNYTLTKTLNAVDITDSGSVPEGEVVRSKNRTATFVLPYAHNSSTGLPTSETPDKATATNFVVSGISYGNLVKVSDNYVTAPRQINDKTNNKTLNFQYWEITKTNTTSVVAKCYFYSFNFIVYDNYTIEPIYAESATPYGVTTDKSTNITYLESSRNQYNGDGSTTTGTAAEQRAAAADLIYNDFVLSYNYRGADIYANDSTSSAVTQLGMVVERVQQLDTNQDGTPITNLNHYSEVSVKTEEEIETFIQGSATTSGTLSKSIIAKTALDNKNRIEFYKAYYNSAGWNKDTQKPGTKYAYKNYVYKAYTYMIVNGAVVLSDPAYFIMYDEAAK